MVHSFPSLQLEVMGSRAFHIEGISHCKGCVCACVHVCVYV